MPEHHPIASRTDLVDAVVYIADEARSLCVATLGFVPRIVGVTLHTADDEDFRRLAPLALSLGVVVEEKAGPRIALDTPILAGPDRVARVRIREPVQRQRTRGSAGIELDDYRAFKAAYLDANPRILKRAVHEDHETIRLYRTDFDVAAYFMGPLDDAPIPAGPALHDDAALEAILGGRIAERLGLHSWPLSHVQRITLTDGRRFAYKAQRPPTVEPEFYARARTTLLPGHWMLPPIGDTRGMAFEWLDAPTLGALGGDAVAAAAGDVVAAIGSIRGDVPVVRDIGAAERWRALADRTLERLGGLIEGRAFRRIPAAVLPRLAALSEGRAIADAVGRSRPANGDLKPEHVFVAGDGFRIIDWARPIVAPPDIDRVALLVDAGMDATHAVDPAVIAIYWFLRLANAVEGPDSVPAGLVSGLFERWAGEAVRHLIGRRSG